MNALQRKLVGGMLVVTTSCLVAAIASHAQSPKPTGAATPSTSAASMDSEKAAIWNSPNMLRARAWLQEYCATSAKVKPGEGQQYMNELQNMSATQMKLWLMKFDEEEEQKQQQHDFWQQAHSAALSQAKAADAATKRSYASIEEGQTVAAKHSESEIDEQRANEQAMQSEKQLGPDTTYGQGYYPGEAGIHYHFHIYPY